MRTVRRHWRKPPANTVAVRAAAPTLILAAGLLATAGGTSPALAATGRAHPAATAGLSCTSATCTLTTTTSGPHGYTVPPGVTSLAVTLYGGVGGTNDAAVPGGDGAEVTANLAVTAGESLNVGVGGAGTGGTGTVPGGTGGGEGSVTNGLAGAGGIGIDSGSGGGMSDIETGPTSPILVAAGGGGSGADQNEPQTCLGPANTLQGGAGGNADTPGGAGQAVFVSLPGGGAGGAGSTGGPGAGGSAGTPTPTFPCGTGQVDGGLVGAGADELNGGVSNTNNNAGGGGGGGGYYGGGAGGQGAYAPELGIASSDGGGGGGGSYTAGPGVSNATLTDTGNSGQVNGGGGEAVLSYPNPVTTGTPSYSTGAGQPLGVPAASGLLSATAGTGGPSGDKLSLTQTGVQTTTAGGSVEVLADGGFIYTPPSGFSGTDSFSYTVTDASGDDATGTVTLGVQPIAQAITFTTTPPNPATISGPAYTPAATGGASGNPVTFSIDPVSTGGACSIASGVVSFTGAGTCVVDANQAGGGGYAAAPTATQSITVDQAPAFVLDSPPLTATTAQVYSYTFAASGTPAPAYTLTGAPAWLSVDPSTGTVTGVPPQGTTSFSYQVAATNAAGTVSAGPFIVSVKASAHKANLSAALSCPKTLAVGGTGTCTLTVTNHGPHAATGVVAEVSLPSKLAEVACGGCTRNQNVFMWKQATLEVGGQASFVMTVKGARTGAAAVTAVVDSSLTDPQPGNNFANATVTIVKS